MPGIHGHLIMTAMIAGEPPGSIVHALSPWICQLPDPVSPIGDGPADQIRRPVRPESSSSGIDGGRTNV